MNLTESLSSAVNSQESEFRPPACLKDEEYLKKKTKPKRFN